MYRLLFLLMLVAPTVGCVQPGDIFLINGIVATKPSHLRSLNYNLSRGYHDRIEDQMVRGDLRMIKNKLGRFDRAIKIGRVSPRSSIGQYAWEFTMLEGEHKARQLYVHNDYLMLTVRKVKREQQRQLDEQDRPRAELQSKVGKRAELQSKVDKQERELRERWRQFAVDARNKCDEWREETNSDRAFADYSVRHDLIYRMCLLEGEYKRVSLMQPYRSALNETKKLHARNLVLLGLHEDYEKP